jgi:hypothetical protein
MKKALLISLAIVIALVGYCSYPFVSVVAITIRLVDQAGEAVRGEAEAVFLDAAGKEIVTVTLETRGSWDNNLHWWARNDSPYSLLRPADARRARSAVVSVPQCESVELPIQLRRTYEPLSFAPHGGGSAYLLYEFERELVLICDPERVNPPIDPGPYEGG